MAVLSQTTAPETESTDHSALRLMLSYVEAECRRIGLADAAKHAALAAALMPETLEQPVVAAEPRRPRSLRLH
ncbi:hypothetical protein [Siccirubricoccus sp. G192]|uniref:hypothetical protein n=1 Tax=Siccirubricoccus sp. G192 TaxID=2849651 RepID=UPI001C2C28D5|nr:hypothetical protein [Siccirubricoccus sp. G192]MBV1796231.1 hypothetical protein [Siccirubricoccus sp. G192]